MAKDLSKSSIFLVIDAKTPHNLLLRRPWLCKHGIMASALHQYLKYYRDREWKINGDVKPFIMVESHFTGARFSEESVTLKETMPSTTFSIGKGDTKECSSSNKR